MQSITKPRLRKANIAATPATPGSMSQEDAPGAAEEGATAVVPGTRLRLPRRSLPMDRPPDAQTELEVPTRSVTRRESETRAIAEAVHRAVLAAEQQQAQEVESLAERAAEQIAEELASLPAAE